jgi:Fe-S oxidoreductase
MTKSSGIYEAVVTEKRSSGIPEFLDRCTACGACAGVCSFLKTTGTPDTIVSRENRGAFLCTSCGACDSICPEGLSPREALMQAKSRLIAAGQVSQAVDRAVHSSLRFAEWGRTFPFTYYPSVDIVFWPGCLLAGSRPDIVKKAAGVLSAHFKARVGVALDCCFDPAYQVGDLASVQDASRRIGERIRKHGITRVVTGCANCLKIFSRYLPDIKAEHIIEVLPERSLRALPDREYYLHHPCPSYEFNSIQGKVKQHLAGQVISFTEPSHAICCGLGGGMEVLSKEKSDSFTQEVISASRDLPIITYCMGCKEHFLKKGKRTYHILEFLTDARPAEQPVSSFKKWINRFLLSLYVRVKEILSSVERRA